MKDNWKEKLKNLIESVIFCTWDCKNLDVDPPVTEKGMTLEETVKAKLPQFEKFINALLASQLKEVLVVIKDTKKQLKAKGNGLPYEYAVEILDFVKAELSQLAEGEE